MRRIIGMLIAVCFCFGMCIQANVSEAARWQTVFTDPLKNQWQIDLDSVQRIGYETYCVNERTVDKYGKVDNAFPRKYKVEKEKTLMYNGLFTDALHFHGDFNPAYSDSAFGQTYILAYLNQTFGDKSVECPNWMWFYSSDTYTYTIDVNSITKMDGIYYAWVQMSSPLMEEYLDYAIYRNQYKKDKQGRLWVRCQYMFYYPTEEETESEWQLAKGNEMYPTAEKEFAFIKAYFGEK